jgi:Nup53/35/40-type RNA recognition motif
MEPTTYEDSWVTVFGFLPERNCLQSVLQEFQSCGNIQRWHGPPGPNCNWVYIKFENAQGAQRALQCNGTRSSSLDMLLGVLPLSSYDRKILRQIDSSTAEQYQGAIHASLPERNNLLSTTYEKVRLTICLHGTRNEPCARANALAHMEYVA